jgi:hypothetical protein
MDFDTQTLSRSPSCIQTRAKPQVTASWIPACLKSLVLPQEPVSAVLEYVTRFDYSQVPVYDGARYIGILTTNAIARWLAHQLTLNQGLAEGEPVDRVLAFAEPHERAKLVGRSITGAEAIAQLTHGGEGRTPVTVLIVTETGRATEQPAPSGHHQQRPADTVGCTRNRNLLRDLFWQRTA